MTTYQVDPARFYEDADEHFRALAEGRAPPVLSGEAGELVAFAIQTESAVNNVIGATASPART